MAFYLSGLHKKMIENNAFMENALILEGFLYATNFDFAVRLPSSMDHQCIFLKDGSAVEGITAPKQKIIFDKIHDFSQKRDVELTFTVNINHFKKCIKKVASCTKNEILLYVNTETNNLCLGFRDETTKIEISLQNKIDREKSFYRFYEIKLLERLVSLFRETEEDVPLTFVVYAPQEGNNKIPITKVVWETDNHEEENLFYLVGKKDQIVYF